MFGRIVKKKTKDKDGRVKRSAKRIQRKTILNGKLILLYIILLQRRKDQRIYKPIHPVFKNS